jgi:hypothetical protein
MAWKIKEGGDGILKGKMKFKCHLLFAAVVLEMFKMFIYFYKKNSLEVKSQ